MPTRAMNLANVDRNRCIFLGDAIYAPFLFAQGDPDTSLALGV
jgi:hypothetical protein